MKTQTYVSRPNTPTQIPVEYYPPFSPSPLPPPANNSGWDSERLRLASARPLVHHSCSRSQPELLAAESEESLAPRVQQLTRGRKKKQQQQNPKPIWCDVSHLSVKTLLSDKGQTLHHPKLHTSLGRPNTSTMLQ